MELEHTGGTLDGSEEHYTIVACCPHGRSITIYNAGSGSVTLDMAYLSGFAQIASGVRAGRPLCCVCMLGEQPWICIQISPCH